jgi:hypothetical protein
MLKKRPSSGYDKPRQPDASDLRVAASVVIKLPLLESSLIAKSVPRYSRAMAIRSNANGGNVFGAADILRRGSSINRVDFIKSVLGSN